MSRVAWLDIAERVGFTWLQSFVGLLALDQTGALGDMDWSLWRHAAASATVAALSALKGALASARTGGASAGFGPQRPSM